MKTVWCIKDGKNDTDPTSRDRRRYHPYDTKAEAEDFASFLRNIGFDNVEVYSAEVEEHLSDV